MMIKVSLVIGGIALAYIVYMVNTWPGLKSAGPTVDTERPFREAVVSYEACPGALSISQMIAMVAAVDDEKMDGSDVTGYRSSGSIALVSVYTKSQGGDRKHEYKFSYDTMTRKVSGENTDATTLISNQIRAC